MLCVKCNSNNVSTNTSVEPISYKDNKLSVKMEFSLCGNCGREFITKQQIQANDKCIRDAKRGADGLLMAKEISTIRDDLGLTQQQAAQVFGGGVNAFSKYERSEVVQSASMDKLIRLACSNRLVLNELLEMVGLEQLARTVEKAHAKAALLYQFPSKGDYKDYCSNDEVHTEWKESFGG